jgi:hypothetical protein
MVVDAPGSAARQVEAWFFQSVQDVGDDDVNPDHVRRFFDHEMPARFPGMRVVALVPKQVPAEARWLVVLEDDIIPPPGVRDPFGWASNRWSTYCDLDGLVRQTGDGSMKWSRGGHGGFKAGGRCPDAGEMWLTLAWCGDHYVLAARLRRRLCEPPIRERHVWWRRLPLRRLWRELEGQL